MLSVEHTSSRCTDDIRTVCALFQLKKLATRVNQLQKAWDVAQESDNFSPLLQEMSKAKRFVKSCCKVLSDMYTALWAVCVAFIYFVKPEYQGRYTPAAIQNEYAVHIAAAQGDLYVVKQLLKKNPAFLNKKEPELGCTPLIGATIGGWKNVVEFLVKRGAELDLQDNEGCTALIRAVSRCQHSAWRKEEHRDIVEFLVARGAKLDLQDNRGRTARTLLSMVLRR